MRAANVLHAWCACKSGRRAVLANAMPSPRGVLLTCVWALFLASEVAGLHGGQELDNDIIRTISGETAADVWVPRFVFNHKTICAGVTLTAEADLTSASCLKDDEPLEAFVVVESHGQEQPPVQVAHIDRCVKFDQGDQRVHDLMVCFHHCRWNFSDDVFVPSVNLESHRVPDKTCRVMGFGHMTPDGDKCNVLHTMEINVGTSQDCGSQDSTVQNYICGATAEQQDSCAVDGGEPLLCQHDDSKLSVHGICKQEDCSAPQKYSKFILLSYYRDWLERTVPGLVPFSGSQEDVSSHGEERVTKTEMHVGITATDQNDQELDRREDEAEKCPILPFLPVHIHHHSLTKEHAGAAIPNGSPSVRQAISPAVRPNNLDSSRAAESVSVSGAAHDHGMEANVGGDRFETKAVPSTSASLPSDEALHTTLSASPTVSSGDVASDFSWRESVPLSELEKESLSRNSEEEVSPNTTPVQTSPGDLATVVPPNSASSGLNVTVLLASLSDSWYLSNATNSAPHLSDSHEKLDLDRLEKLISDNGASLNFSYVVDGTNLFLPGYKNRSAETAPKLLSSTGNESAKSADSTDQMKSTGLKSADSIGKPGQVPVDSSNLQNVIPQDSVSPVQEMGHAPITDAPQDGAATSATPLQNLNTEPPRPLTITRKAPPNTLTLSPSQWDWLKQNAMRIPKNPLKYPKSLGKNLLFKQPRRKNDTLSRARYADEYSNRRAKEQKSESSESSSFPRKYREKWSAQSLSYSRLHPSFRILEDVKTPQVNQSHPLGKRVPKRDVSSRAVRNGNFPPTTVSRVTLSGFHNRPEGDRTLRSLPNRDTHSDKAVDTRIWRNAFERTGLSRDTQQVRATPSSPAPTAGRKEEWQATRSSANRRQPEGTFFGVVSSTVKTRMKRSEGPEEPSDWKTLLADLADWPARVGIAPSQLTPRVSFLTAVNDTSTHVDILPTQSFYAYFRVLRAFLPGGNMARRLDMYKKKLLWGPPITYNEFTPLKPGSGDFGREEAKPEVENGDTSARFDAHEYEGSVGEAPENRQYGHDEDAAPTVPDEEHHREAREVKNHLPTTPSAGTKRGTDGYSVGAELRVKKENQTAGGRSNCTESPNRTNLSDRPHSEIAAGAIRTVKETTLSTVATQKETILSAVDARKEATVSVVTTGKETTLSAVDTGKETKLSAVDTGKETTLSAKETTLSAVHTAKETTLSAVFTGKETTLSAVHTGKETTLSAVHTGKETTLSAGDKGKETTLSAVDKGKETTLLTVDMGKETTLSAVDKGKETILSAIDKGKETTLSAVDKGKDTTLSTVDAWKETTLPTVNRQKDTTSTTSDTRKDTLSTTNKEIDTLLSKTDVQKETTLPKGDTGREPKDDVEIVNTLSTIDVEKLNLLPTVRTIEMEEPSDEKFADDDREGEALQDAEDQDQEQEDFYEKIRRLGADSRASAACELSSVLGAALTLVLTWIFMPQI